MAPTGTRAPVLVAGAGALGSVVGGLLAADGWPVTLLGRREHVERVGRDGLHVDGLFGTRHVRSLACAWEPAAIARPARGFAVVLLTVKAHDTAAMTAAVAPLLAGDGHLLSMQNGLGNLETAAATVGPERVLGARVIFGAELPEPGRARVTVCAAPVLIGSFRPGAGTAAAARWAAALAEAGVPAGTTPDIVAELWAKVLYNAGLNPLGALLGVAYGHLAEDPDTRAIMEDVITEAFTVARADGVALRWPSAEAYLQEFFERLVPTTAQHRSSMLQDVERGRPTEIDAINGWVVRRGTALGVPTPANALVTRLIRARVRRARASEEPWSH
jgi:2-dehydropantoate 2-reductase